MTRRAPMVFLVGALFMPFTCSAMPPKTHLCRTDCDQAASDSIFSNFSLAPLAQPCHRGIVIERDSR